MKAQLILAAHTVAAFIQSYADDRHLTTDPACVHFAAPRPGTLLDRASHGVACIPCMVERAYDRHGCSIMTIAVDRQNGGQ